MKKAIQDAVNDQIRAEFESAYLYLAMAARFESRNLKGFAHWLRLQWQEETQHAMKFYDYLLQRDGTVELQALARPEVTFETPVEAFEAVLKHERYITGRINDLYDLAVAEREYPLQTLLHWFIDEQVEEEDAASEILDNLRIAGDAGPTLFMLDRELSQRRPEPNAGEAA